MDNNLEFKTYLFLSRKKIILSVKNNSNDYIYNQEFNIKSNKAEFIINELENILENNIFRIEKKIKNFIKKVDIILEFDDFFNIGVSIKNNFENLINSKNLDYLLNEIKNCSEKTIDNREIIHMIIENYKIDERDYSNLPENLNSKNFSIDVKFICLSRTFVISLEKVLKKYQISLGKLVNANYIRSFQVDIEKQDREDLFLTAQKIIEGLNPNEVIFIAADKKKQGFFEKFFNLFG